MGWLHRKNIIVQLEDLTDSSFSSIVQCFLCISLFQKDTLHSLQEIFTVSFQHLADLTNSSFGIRKKLELNLIQKIK